MRLRGAAAGFPARGHENGRQRSVAASAILHSASAGLLLLAAAACEEPEPGAASTPHEPVAMEAEHSPNDVGDVSIEHSPTPVDPAAEGGQAGAGEGSDPEPSAPPEPAEPSKVDPRAVPPGTPESHAKAFVKLPLAVSDGPPVGAIGATGIHLDDIKVGSGWARSRCEGIGDRFSISAGDQVNVCIRAVHPRIEEEVMVLWQKDGRTARRRKVMIRNIHAYRTRAYLALRPEYVGDWAVKIVSEDGAELGSASFAVTE